MSYNYHDDLDDNRFAIGANWNDALEREKITVKDPAILKTEEKIKLSKEPVQLTIEDLPWINNKQSSAEIQ